MARPLPYIVEPMTLDDVDQVMQIERVAFSAPWTARAFRFEITENEHSTMVVVRATPQLRDRLTRWLYSLNLISASPLLGYAGSWLLVDDAHIATIATHPRYRRRGLGALLLLSLLERSRALGAIRATLEVRVSNQAAQALYAKYGFEIVSRRKRYYSDNNEDAYIMATPTFATPLFQDNLRLCQAALNDRLWKGAEQLDKTPKMG
jgi:ribosomal-protein-alanine N-acetyltransferase